MSENVKVAVRVRPFNQREKNMNAKLCIEMDRGTQQTILHPQEPGNTCLIPFNWKKALMSC